MNAPMLGEAATRLLWLCPSAASLAALTRPATAWEQVRADPGCVLLLLRAAAASGSRSLVAVADAAVLDLGLSFLDQGAAGFVSWNSSEACAIYDACLGYARAAQQLAEKAGHADPQRAWTAGLLAPLGWLAMCAVDPAATSACLADPEYRFDPLTAQRRRWGLDHAAIARRLAHRWQLPAWLTVIVGHLNLAPDLAQTLGADVPLFRIVQMAVRHTPAAPLLGSAEVVQSAARVAVAPPLESRCTWEAPAQQPLLPDLLRLAAENQRLRAAPVLERLENEVDELHRAVAAGRRGDDDRLQAQKLSAVAELAAGAGHEINNPLAVISGQAQHLLAHETEPSRQRSLQAIINQAQRIHQILSELMQFARPPRPQKQLVDLGSLMRDVTISLQDLAQERQVRVNCPDLEPSISLLADPRQVRTAMLCLLRNAIEAAPADGWAGIRIEPSRDLLQIVVEDSGPGPNDEQREHLFDPFFSGRSAGRGKGLGLPTAWRLAQQHGGDVVYARPDAGPTRFILTLPLEVPPPNSANGNGKPHALVSAAPVID